jgi:hypothetical protein
MESFKSDPTKFRPLAREKVSPKTPDFNRPHIALQPLAFIIAIGDHGLRRPTTTSHDLAYPRHVALPSLTLAPNVSLI